MAFRLKCDKCGHTTESATRDRRCKQIVEEVRGLNPPKKYYCWGRLLTHDRARKETTDLEKAEHAGRQLAAAMAKVKRAMTSVDLWTRRQKYYMAKAEGRIRREAKPTERKPKRDRDSRAIELED
jgi:hypothetical protein